MNGYHFIETRDPFESRDAEFVAETAAALKERDNEVTVFPRAELHPRGAPRHASFPARAGGGARPR